MQVVTGDLADMVDVIDGPIEHHAQVPVVAQAFPFVLQLPVPQRDADHSVALEQGLDLVVVEFSLVRDQRAAVGMAGQHRSVVVVQAFPERGVRAVSQVQRDPQALHFGEQWRAELCQSTLAAGPTGVTALGRMGRPDQSQAPVPPVLELSGIEQCVGALHADDQSQWRGRLGIGILTSVPPGPLGDVLIEPINGADDAGVPLSLQGLVVGQLSPGDGEGLFGRPEVHVRDEPSGRREGVCGGEAQRHPTATHLLQRHGALALALLRFVALADAGRPDAGQQVAVFLQGVHGQVEMAIDNQHGGGDYFFLANAASISLITAGSSGLVLGPKRPITLPWRSMMNFSKFQATLPAPLGFAACLVRCL